MANSKYVDITAIMQVIGNVYNHPELLDQDEKYIVTDDDFPDQFHRIIFGAIYKIHELGATKITLETISDFLSSRPKSEAIYKTQKGEEWLLNVSQNAEIESFDYYYSRLKKMSLLRAYDAYGIDVTDIYDPDNILDSKKKERQEEYIDNSTLEDIANKVDNKIDSIKLKYVDDALNEAIQAGDGIDNLIENLKSHPEVGVPLYGPLINTITRGARLKKFYLRSAASGTGKALPNDQIIPTPDGFRRVGEIKKGDALFDEYGKPVKVKMIHPQKEKKKPYLLVLEDGREIECCAEHLWQCSTEDGIKVMDTLSIQNRLRQKKEIKLPINKAVEWKRQSTTFDPYVVGLLYGNAVLDEEMPRDVLAYRTGDDNLVDLICKGTGWGKDKVAPSTYIFFNRFTGEYIKNSDIFNNKRIPEEYIVNSSKRRLSLLKGFLDACAIVGKYGNICVVFPINEVKESINTITYSLGMYFREEKLTQYEKKQGLELSRYYLQYPKEMSANLFNTEKGNVIVKANMKCNREFSGYIRIKKIIYSKRNPCEMTCFTVNSDSHLFLAKDFIVTHNTRSMIADICYIACDEIYDESFGWTKINKSEPSLFISTEQELEEIQTMMLAFISNVNEEHILNGVYDKGEEDRVKKAAQILKRAPLYVETLPDFSLQDIENTIKRNIHDHNVLFIFHDYIHSSIKILSEIGSKAGVKLREDNILFMLSTRLKDLCNKYGVFIMSATQLSGDWMTSTEPNQNLLRGARSIGDKIDMGAILLSVREDDLKALEPILETQVFEKPTLKLSIYKNRRGRYKSIYLWCKSDLGTCRITPMFATTWSYEIININDLKINVEESAF